MYYFNQDTLESAWFPPCMICMRLEAKKVCFSCPDAGADGLFYCNECFEKVRDSASFPNFKSRRWRRHDHTRACASRECTVVRHRRTTKTLLMNITGAVPTKIKKNSRVVKNIVSCAARPRPH